MSDEQGMGKIVKSVDGLHEGSQEVIVHFTDGTVFYMIHHQDCCECVDIIDIDGDDDILLGAEWYGVEESTKDDESQEDGIGMWTFYTIRTSKGYVWIRWYGSSNGYYGVGVSHGYKESASLVSRW